MKKPRAKHPAPPPNETLERMVERITFEAKHPPQHMGPDWPWGPQAAAKPEAAPKPKPVVKPTPSAMRSRKNK